jgi:hypothetical protein
MTQIMNLTPHDINIVDDNGNVTHTFPKSGDVLRLDISTTTVDNDGIPTVLREIAPLKVSVETEWEDEWIDDESSSSIHSSHRVAEWITIDDIVIRFPSYEGIIVSAQVAQQLLSQDLGDDFLQLYTVGDTVKDSQGAIFGAKFLVLN